VESLRQNTRLFDEREKGKIKLNSFLFPLIPLKTRMYSEKKEKKKKGTRRKGEKWEGTLTKARQIAKGASRKGTITLDRGNEGVKCRYLRRILLRGYERYARRCGRSSRIIVSPRGK
jgi:hypothetical protein